MPREIVVVEGDDGAGTALLLTLAGRMRLATGRAKVAGLVLPEQAGKLRRRTGYLDCASTLDLRSELARITRVRPAAIFVDHADALTAHDQRAALASLLDDVSVASRDTAVVIGVRSRDLIADLLPASYSYLSLDHVDDLVDVPRN